MENKYLGILPYEEDNSVDFVGRYDETWALYDRIVRNDYTVYYAASGEGKSSLIRAGLIPILRRRDYFPVYIVLNDGELSDITSIEKIIDNRINEEVKKHNVSYVQSEWSKMHFNAELSDVLTENLWWRLRNYCFKQDNTELKPLYIFDQFEEVFTKADYGWTDSFFTWLEELSTNYPPESLLGLINSCSSVEIPTQKNFKALFSFRTEYLGDLDYWCVQKHFIPSLQENRMCLKPLTPEGAMEVIRLNESVLGVYADKIIHGCSDTRTVVGSRNQPCVYALILSVICKTLSDIPDLERRILLERLNRSQDDTIDDILLRFYRKKLKDAGLDYSKDEKIVTDLENALVDEKGKRNRRDTDETGMKSLGKWIELLSDKRNGLVKVVGIKISGNAVVKTVEFPHDRLCKAIDSARKERQGKMVWKLNRRSEWIQFFVNSAVMCIIAYLWNILMVSLKPVMSSLFRSGIGKVVNSFLDEYLLFKSSEITPGTSLDEGFSTLLLMVSLFLYVPLFSVSVVRKRKKWQRFLLILSLLCSILFAWLWLRNLSIHFMHNSVPVLTVVGFFVSVSGLAVSTTKLRALMQKGEINGGHNDNLSYWPLWGGYFIFATYLFYECIFRTTFGTSEPIDSLWALIVLPSLFIGWTIGFFNMVIKKKVLFAVVQGFLLVLLTAISIIPFYNEVRQSYGMMISIFIILLWISLSVYAIWRSDSNSRYYSLTKSKRMFASMLCALVLLSTWLLHLGFNPVAVDSSKICHVVSWRELLVYDRDTLGNKVLGVVCPIEGDTIVPCCVPVSTHIDAMLSKDVYPFHDGYIPIESTVSIPFVKIKKMVDDGPVQRIVRLDSTANRITADLLVTPTMEEYLRRTMNKGLSSGSDFTDSINYNAASLFYEIRKASMDFVLTGGRKSDFIYDLKSLDKLDSLQYRALYKEFEKFSLEYKEIVQGPKVIGKTERRYIRTMGDRDIIGFYRELSRYFLLCTIIDRASHHDVCAMYRIMPIYALAYFASSITNVEIIAGGSTSLGMNTGLKLDWESSVFLSDMRNDNLFAWADLFSHLCFMDMGYNAHGYNKYVDDYVYNIKNATRGIATNMLPLFLASLVDEDSTKNDLLHNIKNGRQKEKLLKIEKLLNERKSILEESLSMLEKSKYRWKAVDSSLERLTTDVLSLLLPVMKENEYGVYNNAFENTCNLLIYVSLIRGHDIGEKAREYSAYLEKRHDLQNAPSVAIDGRKETEELLNEAKKEINRQIVLIDEALGKNEEIGELYEVIEKIGLLDDVK